MTDMSSVGGDEKNREMVKGKLKKSFKICARHMKYNQDFIVVWGAELSLKSVLHIFCTGRLY